MQPAHLTDSRHNKASAAQQQNLELDDEVHNANLGQRYTESEDSQEGGGGDAALEEDGRVAEAVFSWHGWGLGEVGEVMLLEAGVGGKEEGEVGVGAGGEVGGAAGGEVGGERQEARWGSWPSQGEGCG